MVGAHEPQGLPVLDVDCDELPTAVRLRGRLRAHKRPQAGASYKRRLNLAYAGTHGLSRELTPEEIHTLAAL
jgi:hypothetical protein